MEFNRNCRNWKKFENDEIMTIWKGYIAQEFGNNDVLRLRIHHDKPIRITAIELIALVEELMHRLNIKENGSMESNQGAGNE